MLPRCTSVANAVNRKVAEKVLVLVIDSFMKRSWCRKLRNAFFKLNAQNIDIADKEV